MSETKQYDVVIVGGGWCGSALAYKLSAKGKKVLVLEAGIAINGLTTDDDGPEPGNREEFMQTFYMSMAKTPESPYEQNYNAPRPSVLDITTAEKRPPQANCNDNPKQSIDKGYFIQTGKMPFGSTYERRGGGTSWHWLGTSLRMMPNDFKMFTQYQKAVDWPFDYDALKDYYEEAEFEIGVSADVNEQNIHGITFTDGYVYPMAKIPPTILDDCISKALKDNKVTIEGMQLEVTGTPAGRNGVPNQLKDGSYYDNGRRQCQGNTNCTPICPIQAKYDATITMAKALMTGNVDIIYQAVASKVILDDAHQLVTGIEYITYQEIGGKGDAPKIAKGTKYIIAAHAIEAAKLLLMSNTQKKEGVANTHGHVGRNLMDHPMHLAWGLMPEPVYPFRGPLSTSGIETVRDGIFRKERAAYRIEIGNEGWNWPAGAPYNQMNAMISPVSDKDHPNVITPGIFGNALRKKIQADFTRQFRIGFLIEQLPDFNNYIKPSDTCKDNLGIPRPEICYDLDDYTKKGFKAAADATNIIFGALGVTPVKAPPLGDGGIFTDNSGATYYAQGAGHVMGTHRMGNNPETSVTDGDMKCHDHDNLYLVGCGSFPTTATPNPSLTMMALAFKAADAILKTFIPEKNVTNEQKQLA
ncbi:Choline dehydrogenase [Filimonas lacunae]|uniref:Choline dehydrogenase n=1 Tax=Filimonas lacunae TaxID=477680 RepID=A0A173ME57_9BACT|nr:GMC family oxidoreductase [Filimonas lacunae]BAV05882.1 glucose-methanol-choline (GMC) oxidoreductase:NAD binding site [Filimonas lacunae]SIT34572.1 Choline dehydrogenase [Filimonas lacunae]